jgi:diacylglycerol O-acyltransferase
MLSAYPLGPAADGVPLNITVQSYIDKLCFGLTAGREAVPELWDVVDHLDDAVTELSKAAAHSAGDQGSGLRSRQRAGQRP